MKRFLGSMLLVAMVSPLNAAEIAGQIGYMSGTLVAQHADGTIKVMATKAPVLEGDMLVTSQGGYAQVKMNDGSVMTMRPESNLKIEAFKFNKETPQADNAVFRLLKGGFRTVTGWIGKRGNPDAYKLRAATATVGIRGTEYSARLCADGDCASGSEATPAPAQATAPKAIGRVMLLQGTMIAKDEAGKQRKLLLGAPVHEGDTLNTASDSNAVVAFRDGGRITLQASSVFKVEKFRYDKAADEGNAALRLLKGGVRVVTGLIGRANKEQYQFGVAGATIGIRGTGFDAWCNGACASGGNPGATQNNPLDGAGVYVWSGAVVLITPQGSVDVALQQAAMIARDSGRPVPVFVVPRSIIENGAPRPDSIPVDLDKEFNESNAGGGAGLYVTVHDGQVVVTQNGQTLNLGAGENGYSNGSDLLRLAAPPVFMSTDEKIDLEKTGGKEANSALPQGGCVVQ